MAPTQNIFDTLAQQDTQRTQHDQSVAPANQPNVFDQIAANNGQAPTAAPPPGPTMGATPTNDPQTLLPNSAGPFERGALKIAAPFARKAMDAVDKLREIENFTQEGEQEHPVQAFMGHIANKLEGFLFGNERHPEAGIGTGKSGMLTNPITASLIPGAEGEPAAAAAIKGGASLVKGGYQTVKDLVTGGKAAEGAPSLVKQVLKGEKVAQEPAKSAVRATVGAEDEAKLLEGNKTVVDEHLKGIAAKEKAAYEIQDKAAGFDVKETRAKLKDAEWKVKQPEIDEATRERLTKTIGESKQSISDAEGKLKEAGINPKEADTLHQQRMAGQDFKKTLIQHISPDGESVSVDGLLNASKKLRFSKYGDRLEQFMGKEGAEKYMKELQDAQDMGAHALKVRKIAEVIGGTLGAGATIAGSVYKAVSH